METLKLYGYICGHEQAVLTEEIPVSKLQAYLDRGKFGSISSTLCGCDMWEELKLCSDGTFLIMRVVRQDVPSSFRCLNDCNKESDIFVEIYQYEDSIYEDSTEGRYYAYVYNCRAKFKLEDNNIVYIK